MSDAKRLSDAIYSSRSLTAAFLSQIMALFFLVVFVFSGETDAFRMVVEGIIMLLVVASWVSVFHARDIFFGVLWKERQ